MRNAVIRVIKSIGDVAIMVADGRKSAEWYREKLGFKIFSSEGHWITVGPANATTVLHLCEGDLEPGNTGVGFVVEDIQKTYEELSSKGVEFTKKPADEGSGMYAMFKDPDGNEFWLTA